MKINKSKIRAEAAKKIADAFISSGEAYSCTAAVCSHQRQQALDIAKSLLDQGINLSKSNYAFAFSGLMADMFLSDAAKLVHQHYYPGTK
jgi:hypothetical protein